MGVVSRVLQAMGASVLLVAMSFAPQPGYAVDRYIDAIDDPGRWVIGNPLAEALIGLQQIAQSGGYTQVPEGRTLRPGERGVAIEFLDRRLREGSDLVAARPDPGLFDPVLERAVLAFQARHGLEVDGLVGRQTLAALNAPVERLIDRVLVNLARLDDAPDVSTGKVVMVNLPEYRLRAYDDGEVVLAMNVIVGRRSWETPVLSTTITHLILNPTWTVPPGILTRTVAPAMLAGEDYLSEHELAPVSPLIDVATIDWQSVAAGARTVDGELLRLRQAPGPTNPLGRYRFHMPNSDHIFLHDTNEPELFDRRVRALSSGCVRLGDPQALAAFVAGDAEDAYWRRYDTDPGWSYRWILLEEPVPVHLLYHTVWVDDRGVLQVRPDIYGWDRTAIAALDTGLQVYSG